MPSKLNPITGTSTELKSSFVDKKCVKVVPVASEISCSYSKSAFASLVNFPFAKTVVNSSSSNLVKKLVKLSPRLNKLVLFSNFTESPPLTVLVPPLVNFVAK